MTSSLQSWAGLAFGTSETAVWDITHGSISGRRAESSSFKADVFNQVEYVTRTSVPCCKSSHRGHTHTPARASQPWKEASDFTPSNYLPIGLWPLSEWPFQDYRKLWKIKGFDNWQNTSCLESSKNLKKFFFLFLACVWYLFCAVLFWFFWFGLGGVVMVKSGFSLVSKSFVCSTSRHTGVRGTTWTKHVLSPQGRHRQ